MNKNSNIDKKQKRLSKKDSVAEIQKYREPEIQRYSNNDCKDLGP